MTSEAIRARREEIVLEHMSSEQEHRFEDTLRTFSHPRYEVVPTGEIIDGEAGVRAFYDETDRAFPDFRFENTKLRHLDDGVLVETDFVGTHLGPWRGLPATGQPVRYRMCNVFEFDGERLLCERLYFDLLTALQQLGIARDPTSLGGRLMTFVNHPLVVARAFVRAARRPRT